MRAVIIEVDSPGGGVTASDVLYHRVRDFRESGTPVVVLIKDIAASGGYYVSAGADEIVAHPTSITGSIGVVLTSLHYRDFLNSHGVTQILFKSGDMKDILSPMRDMTESESQLLQEIVDSMFVQFKEVVLEGREGRMTEEDFDEIADGRILTADEALDVGLVDKIGYLDDAVASAKQAAGLGGASDVAVVRYWNREGLSSLFRGAARMSARTGSAPLDVLAERVAGGYRGSPFLYLWPGP